MVFVNGLGDKSSSNQIIRSITYNTRIPDNRSIVDNTGARARAYRENDRYGVYIRTTVSTHR
jgi:hypothetical protein